MNDSIWNDPRITAYVLDELDDRDRDAFEAEMRSNRPLAAAVDEARGIADRLATVFEEEPTPSLDAGRRATIPTGLPSDLVSQRSDALSPYEGVSPAVGGADVRSGGWRWGVIALGVAATLLVVVGVTPRGRNVTSVAWNLKADESRATGEREATRGEAAGEPGAIGGPAGGRAGTSSFSSAADERESFGPDPSDATGPRGRSRLSPLGVPENVLEAERSLLVRPSRTPGSAREEESAGEDTVEKAGVSLDSPAAVRPAGPRSRAESPGPAAADVGAYGARSTIGDDVVEDFRADDDDAAEDFAATPRDRRKTSGRMGLAQLDSGAESESKISERRIGTRPESAEASRAEDSRFAGDVGNGLVTGLATLPEQTASVSPKKMGGLGGGFGETDRGRGPGMAGDRFDPIVDNPFRRVSEHPLATFSVDVDTASYAKVRDLLLRAGRLPRPDAVRIEELMNYFDYGYEAPASEAEHPFRAGVDLAVCPWNRDHRLARVSIQGRRLDAADRPRANLVFLVDTSGSMNAPNRLPLVRDGLKRLVDQLDEGDRIAIVTYAGAAGMVLDSTPTGEIAAIRRALTELTAGGSTNGGAGITLAYQTARDHFIADGVNRVVLCTDGDFNVGATGTDELVRTVEQEAKGGVFLSVLGFGTGNHNDAMLEQISGRGNGNYFFIDNAAEARKVLVEQASGTLVTIAKDVKLQLEFNPRRVSAYRLIGYENRMLAAEDFHDDRKDAGEIGAGHSVTALLELVPAGKTADASPPAVDELRYQTRPELTDAAERDEWLALKLRYKRPDEETSRLIEASTSGDERAFDQAEPGFRFAAAVAGFGMQLRRSKYAGRWSLADVRRAATDATDAIGDDRQGSQGRQGSRGEFLRMVERAIEFTAAEPGTNRPLRPTAPQSR